MKRSIELDKQQVQALERLAAAHNQSVDDLVREAVDGYLVQRNRDWSDWNKRFDTLVARIRAHVPPDVTPEEIEADITAARAEVRAERAAQRVAADTPHAGRR